jgi:hypothetical protein
LLRRQNSRKSRSGSATRRRRLARRRHAEEAGQARGDSGHHAVLDGPAEDSVLRSVRNGGPGAVPGLGSERFLSAER